MKKIIAILLVAILATLSLTTVFAEDFYGDDWCGDTYGPSYEEIVSITGSYSDRVLSAMNWKDGLVATLEGDEVGYFVDGKVVALWPCPTSYEDFFIDLSKGFPDAEYSLCLVLVTGELITFHDNISMNLEETDVYTYGFNLDWSDYFMRKGKSLNSYFFLNQGGALYYWSPYAKVLLSIGNVNAIVVNVDYVLFADDAGVHVINASLAEMNLHNQRFFSYHPLPIIDMGNVNIWDFCGDLYGVEGTDFVRTSDWFDQKYGTDFSIWGSIKARFTLEDFAYYPSRNIYALQEAMDTPEDDYANPIVYHDVSFCDHDGYLAAHLLSPTVIKQLRWTCYDGSVGVYNDIKRYILGAGGVLVSSGTYQDGEFIEESVYKYTDQLIHVAYRDNGGDFEIVVYANNMEVLNE